MPKNAPLPEWEQVLLADKLDFDVNCNYMMSFDDNYVLGQMAVSNLSQVSSKNIGSQINEGNGLHCHISSDNKSVYKVGSPVNGIKVIATVNELIKNCSIGKPPKTKYEKSRLEKEEFRCLLYTLECVKESSKEEKQQGNILQKCANIHCNQIGK